ncbi:MAG: hypothetical protein JW738_04605 [Actinobacteria bacterium]|nr:hypothetical protein [Actinomycetota bacterium]
MPYAPENERGVVDIASVHVDFDDETEETRKEELDEIELEKRQLVKQAALAKFSFFLHLTGYLSGCAYLVILGILFPRWMPFVFIPVAIWTVGIVYHGYRSFHTRLNKMDS